VVVDTTRSAVRVSRYGALLRRRKTRDLQKDADRALETRSSPIRRHRRRVAPPLRRATSAGARILPIAAVFVMEGLKPRAEPAFWRLGEEGRQRRKDISRSSRSSTRPICDGSGSFCEPLGAQSTPKRLIETLLDQRGRTTLRSFPRSYFLCRLSFFFATVCRPEARAAKRLRMNARRFLQGQISYVRHDSWTQRIQRSTRNVIQLDVYTGGLRQCVNQGRNGARCRMREKFCCMCMECFPFQPGLRGPSTGDDTFSHMDCGSGSCGFFSFLSGNGENPPSSAKLVY